MAGLRRRLPVGRLAELGRRLRVGRDGQYHPHQRDYQPYGQKVPVPAERESLGRLVPGCRTDCVRPQPSLHFTASTGVEEGASQTFVEVETSVRHPSDLDNGGPAQSPGTAGHECGDEGEAGNDQGEVRGRGDLGVDQDDGDSGGPAGEGQQSPVEGGVAQSSPA